MFNKKFYILIIVISFSTINCFSQEDLLIKAQDTTVISPVEFDMLSPAKAAFYSAILPGLGQAYNKKYWKIPLVWGALGSGIYFYDLNSTNYNRARTAFKLKLDGKPNEFDGVDGNILLSEDALIRAQKSYKKDRDLSLLVTVALYVLQVLEASTNAHLLQHNVDNNLSLSPQIIQDAVSNKSVVVASLNFKF
ncbi:DUF5683 domain-containing protein [Lutibacter flavus]|uniref:DUF5683 domain-containing protein n=1 Tax=Lutibacter flavus TaxID=691689 RepID=A0A238V8K3_9FLAO|nr:DUF5683 domain-containing protein [Lutibacter flavus]SNR29869.1 hypothetical protein SAMN04488111_0011 [Lutibacter flavus]